MDETLKKMKIALHAELSEWVGFDIPKEGTEDYENWMSKLDQIEEISSFQDVYDYMSGNEERLEELFDEFGIVYFRSVL